MSTPPSTSPLPARCTACGYALAGLALSLPCPECGCEDPRDPSPVLLRKMRRGLWVAALGTLLFVLPFLLPVVGIYPNVLHVAIFVLAICVLSVGAWIAGVVLARAPHLTIAVHGAIFALFSIPALGVFWFVLLLTGSGRVGEMFLWAIPVLFIAFLFLSAWCLFQVARGLGSRARRVRVCVLAGTYSFGTIGLVAAVLMSAPLGGLYPAAVCVLAVCALLAIADLLLGLKKLPTFD